VHAREPSVAFARGGFCKAALPPAPPAARHVHVLVFKGLWVEGARDRAGAAEGTLATLASTQLEGWRCRREPQKEGRLAGRFTEEKHMGADASLTNTNRNTSGIAAGQAAFSLWHMTCHRHRMHGPGPPRPKHDGVRKEQRQSDQIAAKRGTPCSARPCQPPPRSHPVSSAFCLAVS
jgi:hypothetical protein